MALLFSACSESEKQAVVDVVQNINIRNNEVVPTVTALSSSISESSGLAYIDGTLWTHNDSGGEAKLYALDTSNGEILKTVTISNASNVDWEDLAFDDTYLFIGDFGNNNGTRENLKIYKIKRADLETKSSVEAEIIEFSYATQTEFTSNSNTNYDCEAFIAYEDKLYLFSKNHGNEETDMYVLGMNAGVEVAEKMATFDTNALVTGASMDSENKTLALIGYGSRGTPKTWIFSNFIESNFFEGEEDKITWGTPAKAQIEGVTHLAKGKLYVSSERFHYSNTLGSFTINQELYNLNY
jgi:outer membrane protein assembly factor BamB